MAELGAESDRYHGEIASLVDELGIEVVVAVGAEASGYLARRGDGITIPDALAFEAIAGVLKPGDAILVKGSRAVGLEGIPDLIQKHSLGW
jgi:UDP-N-acetylmuramoyl-tripeptide--D-alanyl-D-alanine ligase